MSHTVSFTKLIYNNQQKTPIIKETASSEQTKDATPSPILMDEFGQTPDHFYLAKKPPPSFFQVKRKLDYLQTSSDYSSGSKQKSTKQRKRNVTKKMHGPPIKKLSITYGKTNADKPRYDTSLGTLTKKFLKLLTDAGDNGVMNLNSACMLLSVPKRRLYDITNVLEGAGLIQKTSRNNIQWMGQVSSPAANAYHLELEKDIDILEAKENQLDELIYHMNAQVKMLRESEEKYHYITAEDLKSFSLCKNMVLGMELSPAGQLVETFEKELVLTSKGEEMEAFLLSENARLFRNILNPESLFLSEKRNKEKNLHMPYNIKLSNNCVFKVEDIKEEDDFEKGAENYRRIISPYELICGNTASYSQVCAESENTCTTPPHTNSAVSYSEVCVKTEDICTTHTSPMPHTDSAASYSDICVGTTWTEGETVIKNAFISQEDDIAPLGRNFLLQTTDQDDFYNVIQYADLEMSAENYSFSLGYGEGVTDLFDSHLFS